ncbi:hypothetical protein BJY24_002692 [Nocardia transvalensis]|uniref:Uncharacterized protein n=1 Tax=Nocardia transvalensis TaxID=37333 RepID=A0A7W9PD89_9NOCA|nr:hypothetical protein [Nocardia transvalensis]MBB5913825.1 hypothetical protein [Nocardia transvalensis]
MSQHPATHRRTQILQHTAIVLAGMASIGLTVAAGTYVVNHLGDSIGRPGAESAAPNAEAPAGTPAAAPELRETQSGTKTSELVGLMVVSHPLPLAPVPAPPPAPEVTRLFDRAAVSTAPAQATVDPDGVGARLRLPGDAYVGANVATTQPNSVSMTVDTNVFTVLGDRMSGRAQDTPAGVTRFRTDVDTRSGEVSVAVSDPGLGRRDIQVERHSRPAPAEPVAPQDSGTTA